jgi:16S rRNA (cytosine1402-N4)-methyltransferase
MKRNLKDKNRMNDKNEIGKHIPIMLCECIESLKINAGETLIDATVNRGGHSKEFAKGIGESGTLICFDLDKVAISEAEVNLKDINCKKIFIHSNFRNIKSEIEKVGFTKVDKIFADLGLSSQELDVSGRGFTFQKDEPLHMTLNSEVNENTFTAKDLINNLNAEQLTNIFKNYGDEKNAWKIATHIVKVRDTEERKIETTGDLVEIIEEINPRKPWIKTHPATKIFQALRIATNDEYGALEDLLKDGFQILKSGGIFSIITFHSGEDRIVKNFFREKIKDGLADENGKKRKPSENEISENKRSRSAILRSIIKL